MKLLLCAPLYVPCTLEKIPLSPSSLSSLTLFSVFSFHFPLFFAWHFAA